jgi:hypothetical protein
MKNLLLILAATAAIGSGCGSDAAPEPGAPPSFPPDLPDGGSSMGVDSSAGAVPPSDGEAPMNEAPRCGPPPHQALWLGAEDIMRPADSRELRDVTVTFKHCPESRFLTGVDGRVMVMVTRTAETWIRFEKDGYLPWMVGEVAVTEGLPRAPMMGTMVPVRIGSTVVPGYRPTDPLVYLQVQMGRSDAPEACRSRDDVVFSVKGHPEAQVSYRAAGSNGGYTKTSATSIEGVALISGLPATITAVEILAAKPDCRYRLAYGDVNSTALLPILRTPLAPGTITYQVINPVR